MVDSLPTSNQPVSPRGPREIDEIADRFHKANQDAGDSPLVAYATPPLATGISLSLHVGTRIVEAAAFGHNRPMKSVLFYLLIGTGIVVVAGLIVLIFATRSAPEGFESTDEGFVGLTKGDEMLLNEFAAQRAALMSGSMHRAAA